MHEIEVIDRKVKVGGVLQGRPHYNQAAALLAAQALQRVHYPKYAVVDKGDSLPPPKPIVNNSVVEIGKQETLVPTKEEKAIKVKLPKAPKLPKEEKAKPIKKAVKAKAKKGKGKKGKKSGKKAKKMTPRVNKAVVAAPQAEVVQTAQPVVAQTSAEPVAEVIPSEAIPSEAIPSEAVADAAPQV